MAKRTYGPAVESVTESHQTTSRRYYGPFVQAAVNVKKFALSHLILSVTVLTLLLSGSIFCMIMAHANSEETAEIIQVWDDIRDNAEVTSPNYIGDADELNGMQPDDLQKSATNEAVTTGKQGYTKAEKKTVEPMNRQFRWEYLTSINTDVKCWLYIPDTVIDYPVMQERDMYEYYYLNHGLDRAYLRCGSLFAPDGLEDGELLIYGHNMKEDIMFHSLLRYKNSEEFYLAHPYIYLYYPDRTEKWQVYSAYHTDRDDIVYDMPFEQGETFKETLIKHLSDKRAYKASMVQPDSDNLLVLSTCDGTSDGRDGRMIIACSLVETKYIETSETDVE